MGRRSRRRILVWLAIPSGLFVLFKALSVLGISQVPHRRIAGLYGGQPGASVVLVSALAAFAIALDRVAEVRLMDGRLALRLRLSAPLARVFVFALLVVASSFARVYLSEYAWLYTSGGSGFFEAALMLAVVMAVLNPRRMPGHRHTEG